MNMDMQEKNGSLQVEQQLQAVQERVKQLVYIFSHDMRNPLVNMKALLAELHGMEDELRHGNLEVLDVDMPDVISMLEKSVERMTGMILGANEIYHCMFDEIEREEVSLQEVMARVVRHFKNSSEIEFNIGDLPVISADPLAVNKIVEHLLDNAVTAMEGKGGTVSVSSSTNENGHVLVIRDDGTGMSEEEIKFAFDPFYSHFQSGSGVGLAVVKALVEAHHGRVWCESTPGEGSAFYVALP